MDAMPWHCGHHNNAGIGQICEQPQGPGASPTNPALRVAQISKDIQHSLRLAFVGDPSRRTATPYFDRLLIKDMDIRKLTRLLAAAVVFSFIAAPVAIAADLTDVGFIDQAAIGSLPQFQKANAQIAQYKSQLDPQFAAAMKRAKSPADQQRVQADFQQRFISKQRELLGPLFARAQAAIAQVSSNQRLSVVVDKRIVVFGGKDITSDVVDLVNGPGQVVAPSATPGPSEIGFVDQNQIDQVPKIKNANDDFSKWANDQRTAALKQMQSAKNDPKKQQQIFQNYQQTLTSQQEKVLKPLVDQTRDSMAKVAAQKHLILVVDRSDVIYGGTDITSDVQNALK
jgi:outer membrane protein